MTNIKGFKGITYNLDKITDLSQVVCPPYDVINPQQQDFYYHQSPYNFIRLILNKQEEQNNEANNKYSRAALFFNTWLKDEILKQDLSEAIYFYKQDYFCNEKEYSRLGFIALMQLNDAGVAFPHENTHSAPKVDRLELTKKVEANLSPIFTIFSDRNKIIERVFSKNLLNRKPDFMLRDVDGVRNSIWRLIDKQVIKEICANLGNKQIFIADGHHRYEVASMYRKLMKEKDRNYSEEKSYNYIMTYFTNAESRGLCVLPVHRIINFPIDVDLLKNNFKLKKLNSIVELEDKLIAGGKECMFGLYHNGNSFLLKLIDKKQIKSDFIKKKCFRDLDVAILDYYLLNEVLGIKKDAIMYTKDTQEARDFVDKKRAQAAFLIRLTPVKKVCNVALEGEKMPPKSTYFYPKLLSGLVVHKFSEATTYGAIAT